MNAAVEFHHDRRLQAEEVDDERADRDLSAPLPAFQASAAERFPQSGLGLGLATSEFLRPIAAQLRCDGNDLAQLAPGPTPRER